MVTMKDLHLSLKHEWFMAFKEGDKPVEYREISAYWAKRLIEPTSKWPYDIEWDDLYGPHLDQMTLLANIIEGIDMGIISFRKFGNMVLTDGYPRKDNKERHFSTGWLLTDIGCVNPKWAWCDTPTNKKFFRIWSNKNADYGRTFQIERCAIPL